MILKYIGQVKSIAKTLNVMKANFQLFHRLAAVIPQENALRNKGAEESWQLLKDIFLRAQKLQVPICKKSGK